MSANNFILIGKNNIYNKNEILSLNETVEKVEVERKIIIVHFKDSSHKPHKIICREEQNIGNSVSIEALNA